MVNYGDNGGYEAKGVGHQAKRLDWDYQPRLAVGRGILDSLVGVY
jgi:hypothetical protein